MTRRELLRGLLALPALAVPAAMLPEAAEALASATLPTPIPELEVAALRASYELSEFEFENVPGPRLQREVDA